MIFSNQRKKRILAMSEQAEHRVFISHKKESHHKYHERQREEYVHHYDVIESTF